MVESGGRSFASQAVSTDITEASAEAYLRACAHAKAATEPEQELDRSLMRWSHDDPHPPVPIVACLVRRRHRPRGDGRGRPRDRRGVDAVRHPRAPGAPAVRRRGDRQARRPLPVPRARRRQGVRRGAAGRRRRPALGDGSAASRAGAAGRSASELDTFANLRPGAPRRHRPDGRAGADRRPLLRRQGARATTTRWTSCTYTREQVERVARWAFRLARRRSGRVVSVDKANVLATSKLWRRVVTELHAAEFPEMALTHELVDSFAMNLATRPQALRRDPDREPVRRHPVRPGRGRRRRPRPGAVGVDRHRAAGHLRAGARLGA